MRYQSLAFVAPFLFLQQAYALSNITFYSDDQCTDVLDQKTGPDDGTCTPFPTLMKSYGSFRVSSLDQTCSGKSIITYTSKLRPSQMLIHPFIA